MTTGNKRLDKILEGVAAGNMPHNFHKTGDADNPDSILDRNGEVALALCRACERAEADLEEFCPAGIEVTRLEVVASAFARSSMFKRFIRDGKMSFRVEHTVDSLKLFIVAGGEDQIIFAESNKIDKGDFTEARVVVGEIIQAYSNE